MAKPRLLDLFCCAGGAARGYAEAGFDVFGVDIAPQPNYPYPMMVDDAMRLPIGFLRQFDAIHASPPCQGYSALAARTGAGDNWPKLIPDVRDLLADTGKPYVIENVEGAPLRDYVILCGTMFPGLRVIRHRLFESNFTIMPPPHVGSHPLCHTLDKRKSHYGRTDEWVDFVQVNGGGNSSAEAARDAMGIPWMTKKELNEAIPPAYTSLVGTYLMEELGMAREPSVKDLLKAFFLAHKGEILTSAQLGVIAGVRTEWARRVRELRSEERWPIESNNDNADLKPGQYRLTGDPPMPGDYVIGRRVSQTQRYRILQRNGYTCQACGAGVGDFTDDERPVKLVIDHIQAYSHGGRESDANLRVLCQACNGGANNVAGPLPSSALLLAEIRRARRDDQLKALKWLEQKFR